jgi:hypothetical protein
MSSSEQSLRPAPSAELDKLARAQLNFESVMIPRTCVLGVKYDLPDNPELSEPMGQGRRPSGQADQLFSCPRKPSQPPTTPVRTHSAEVFAVILLCRLADVLCRQVDNRRLAPAASRRSSRQLPDHFLGSFSSL